MKAPSLSRLQAPRSLAGKAALLATGLAATLGAALLCGSSAPAQASPTSFGINLPWLAYGHSFGTDGLHGYSSVYNGTTVQSYLDDMKSKHLNIVRVWLYEDFDGLSFSGDNCTGVSSQFLSNVSDFVTRANNDGITVYCMLFNNNDISSHAYLVEGNQTSLINNAITPLAKALNGKKVQYDLINECDYAASSIGWSNLRTFFTNATKAIHAVSSGDWVTASDDNSSDFTSNLGGTLGGVGFNFYDYHHYTSGTDSLAVTPTTVGHQPLFLGEYGPAEGWSNYSNSTQQSVVDHFAGQCNSDGYTGMLAWSYLPDGENYQLQGTNTLYTIEYYGNEWGIN